MRVLAEYLQSLGSIFSNVKVRISYLCFTCYCSKAMDGTVTGQSRSSCGKTGHLVNPPFCTESVRKFAASLTQMYSKLNTCYMHVYVCMCICVNVHVCVYMYVHVHMYMHVEHVYM